MNKELRRVSIVVLLMFIALFTSTTVIQVFQVDNLNADGRNVRALFATFSAQRGDITAGTTTLATSVASKDDYKFQRTYTAGPVYAPVTGYDVLFGSPTGIEGSLNRELAGTSDSQFLSKINSLITGQAPQGASVQLTIDPALQQAAYAALGTQRGAIVAIEPSTGKILAMVSTPSYDPNLLAVHDTKAANATYNLLNTDPTQPLLNRAINQTYHPGSTFKLIVATAALESGQYTPDSTFPNPSTLKLPQSNSMINNAEGGTCGGGADASIATALRDSCNIPFAQLGLALGQNAIRSQAAKFGFGDTSLDIPMSVTPSQYPENDSDAQTMLSSFGQASDEVTPLQMAMVSAAIANGGKLMSPTLVDSVTAPDLSKLESFSPTVYGTPMSESVASEMTTMMIADVAAGGAASNAEITGMDVAGKTGTAQNGKTDPYTLWFTGFAPANDPKVAVAVVLENGGGKGQSSFGNALAAPIAKKVMEAVVGQ